MIWQCNDLRLLNNLWSDDRVRVAFGTPFSTQHKSSYFATGPDVTCWTKCVVINWESLLINSHLYSRKTSKIGNMQSSISASNTSVSVKLVSFGTQQSRIVVIGGTEEGKGVSDTNSSTISTGIGAGAVWGAGSVSAGAASAESWPSLCRDQDAEPPSR